MSGNAATNRCRPQILSEPSGAQFVRGSLAEFQRVPRGFSGCFQIEALHASDSWFDSRDVGQQIVMMAIRIAIVNQRKTP